MSAYDLPVPAGHSQIVKMPADGLGVSEMLLVADKAHSLMFLNRPSKKAVQIIDVTNAPQPTELKTFSYEADEKQPFHLVEHASKLMEFASEGKDSLRHPHTISLVDVPGKVDRHGAISIKGMCDYITDPHRAVVYALCETNLSVIRTSADDDTGVRLWESTLSS